MDFFKSEISQGDIHGEGGRRFLGNFELEAVESATPADDEIDLRPGVGSPEIGILGIDLQHGADLLQRKAFPGSPVARIALKRSNILDLEEAVQQSGIPQINLGRFDQPFFEVG